MTMTGISAATTAAPFFGAVQTKPKAADTTTGTTSTGSGSLSVGNLGTTFLGLLAQELQNQDPTSPMDPTAMVGQMISLNQLDQLISINQNLTPTNTSATGHTATKAGASNDAVSPAPGTDFSASTSAAALAALDPAQTAASAAAIQSAAISLAMAQSATAYATPLNLNSVTAIAGGK